jgi:hypothetical protein
MRDSRSGLLAGLPDLPIRWSVLAWLLSFPAVALGQGVGTGPELLPDRTVRVLIPGNPQKIEGTVVSLIGTQLTINQTQPYGVPIALDIASADSIELAFPRQRTLAGRGALIGGAALGIVSGLIGFAVSDGFKSCEDHSACEMWPGAGALVAIPGAVVGAIGGALVGRGHIRHDTVWVQVTVFGR